MSTEPEEVEVPAVEERPRLLSVEIGDWPGLGGNVGFTLGERRTVLVGRTGAGKSLIVEGMVGAKNAALFGTRVSPTPRSFRCTVACPNAATIAYEYHMSAETADDVLDTPDTEDMPSRRRASFSERCWTPEDGVELWRIANAMLVQRGEAPRPFLPGEGLMAAPNLPFEVPRQVQLLEHLFSGLRSVPAGVPRAGGGRREIILRGEYRDSRGVQHWRQIGGRRDESIPRLLMEAHDSDREKFEEFVEILRRLGLVQRVDVRIYEDSLATQEDRQVYGSVQFDGMNFGLCSDGTQRVAEIVWWLLREKLTCLLIEEPETAVHPGLLEKLLSEIESYSYDRQVVISTQSPQVVDWCAPEDLRLVERIEGRTRVLPLEREEIARAHRYLAREGTFSEFVYWRSDA
jgi:hypothetical protein